MAPAKKTDQESPEERLSDEAEAGLKDIEQAVADAPKGDREDEAAAKRAAFLKGS